MARKRKGGGSMVGLDSRPKALRSRTREHRLACARVLEREAERDLFPGHERNAERLSRHAPKVRDAAP